MTVIRFHVPGLPISQGSMHARPLMRGGVPVMAKGRPVVNVTHGKGAEVKAWRRAIAVVAKVAMNQARAEALTGPVWVRIAFILPRPKTVTEAKRPLPCVPPDVDKLTRCALDALGREKNKGTAKGPPVCWYDDGQVVAVTAVKEYGEPGASFEVWGHAPPSRYASEVEQLRAENTELRARLTAMEQQSGRAA